VSRFDALAHRDRFAASFQLLHDILLDAARRLPDKVALVCSGERLTYAEIDARSNALAHYLRRQGVRRGDRVLLFLDNTAEAVVAFWAVLKADAVVSVINPQTKADKLAYMLSDCRPAALLTQGWHAPVFVRPAVAQASLQSIVVVRANYMGAVDSRSEYVTWEEALSGGPRDHPPGRCGIDIDLAAIIYTSGSAGQPKGVMLTHRNMLAAATSITTYLENDENDVILCALPLSFDYGLYQMIMAFAVGGRLVLEKSFAYPAEMLRLLVDEQVTGFPGVPTMFAMLDGMPHLGAYDFSRVRYVTNTAAALPVKHLLRLRSIFAGARIYSMYGLTECKRCSYLPPPQIDNRPESVGLAIPNTEMWIVNESDEHAGPNQVGQLVIRGATVMKGYWQKPEATAERLHPGHLPGEQLLYTGDYCRVDDEGYLYFVGRMDDIIKSRGEKVAPVEVERALMSIPGVVDAAVIGVPDDLLGQAVKAFVVLDPGAELTAKALRRECQGRIEGFMVPSAIVIVPELPRMANGKLDRSHLPR